MKQDFSDLTNEQIEEIEKQTLRTIVQALQDYSREAKEIFENTFADTGDEITNLGEDVVQYALEVAELFPINKRLAGSIDYKRVRWMPSPYGLIPQALLVDAKAAKECNRTTLQQSQLPFDADFLVHNQSFSMAAGIPHLSIKMASGREITALSTSIFVHMYYEDIDTQITPFRRLKSIIVLAVPHFRLKAKYNPDAETSYFGKGKESTARQEARRIRIYFDRFRRVCPWRYQELKYQTNFGGSCFSEPIWIDSDPTDGSPREYPFEFVG